MTRHDRPEGRPAGVGTHAQDTATRNQAQPRRGGEVVPVRTSTLPAIDARRDRALTYLHASAPAIACPHLGATVAEGGRGVICAEHPAAGILCPSCAVAHTRRHPHEVEHRCDACGTVAATMQSFIGTADVALATLTTAGRFAAYIGPLMVVALGACPPCATAAGITGLVAK